ncbi:isoprenylcysteine carboxylmethyltransferase family protein [Methylocapsa sp. S129]|uniref:methyltransferase family protein n=1 Tax=Methylocapsa sp. S129 TaxID=1641869 RepID=UPI00131AC232|nr:isoprenylcysteine carboxylmethyltransferase family protein [Methylocapsa sp. S129]
MKQPNLTRRALFGLAWFAVILAAMIFGPAWSLAYWQGWTFWFLMLACCLATTLYLLRHDPALVERRMRSGPTAERESSQKWIMTCTGVLFCAIVIAPALDHRFGWSSVPAFIVIGGDCLIALSFVFILRVFRENSFASAVIEVSAGQKVVSTGPYAWVRHPMYAGALPLLAGVPLALGSYWGLAPVAPLLGAIVWRLLDEERYLSRNLAGYQDYCRKVRWRLAPGVW